jgi:hypothetical protein
LQKYTKEYLFEKFRSEVQLSHRQVAQVPEPIQHAPLQPRQPQASRTQTSLPRSSRPILTIDTPPNPSSNTRHPSLVLAPPNPPSNGDMTHPGIMNQARPAGPKTATSSTSQDISIILRFLLILLSRVAANAFQENYSCLQFLQVYVVLLSHILSFHSYTTLIQHEN